MSQNIPEKIMDITGTELTPKQPAVCPGNGERGFEICCDECDYYLLCFPEFAPKEELMHTDKDHLSPKTENDRERQVFSVIFYISE